MPKKPDQITSWNRVVKCLEDTKKAWEVHREVMMERPSIEGLSIEAQRRLKFVIHRSTSFEKFLRGFTDLWQLRGGLGTMRIPEEVKSKTEGKE